MNMYTRVVGGFDTKYIANPINPEAVTVLARMEYGRPSPAVERVRIPLTWLLSCAGILALLVGITVPEAWWQDDGVNDIYGIIALLALGVGAFGCWYGWLEDIYTANFTKPRFRQLRREGSIVEVPFRVYHDLDERLKAINLKDYAARSYKFRPADFAAIKEIAEADASGTPGAKTWEVAGKELSPLDEVMRTHIDQLLGEIVARIKRAYEEDAAERNGRLEGSHEPERLEGE
jgi:hypothetical protein